MTHGRARFHQVAAKFVDEKASVFGWMSTFQAIGYITVHIKVLDTVNIFVLAEP